MSQLKELFVSFGFSNVETFIASGNVIFESEERDVLPLETRIAAGLQEALGYEVSVFIRSLVELVGIVDYEAFSQQSIGRTEALAIAFLAEPLSDEQTHTLMSLETDIDEFTSHDREVYWLCRVKQSQSRFSNAVMEKRIEIRTTFRSINTLRRIVAKYVN